MKKDGSTITRDRPGSVVGKGTPGQGSLTRDRPGSVVGKCSFHLRGPQSTHATTFVRLDFFHHDHRENNFCMWNWFKSMNTHDRPGSIVGKWTPGQGSLTRGEPVKFQKNLKNNLQKLFWKTIFKRIFRIIFINRFQQYFSKMVFKKKQRLFDK